MKVFEEKIPQGTLHVVAGNKRHAEAQARAFSYDARRRPVRRQAEITPGVFALGSAAKVKLGVEVFGCG